MSEEINNQSFQFIEDHLNTDLPVHSIVETINHHSKGSIRIKN